MTTRNFNLKITQEEIPRFIGAGGKVIFNEVVKKSIDEFKKIEEHTCQKTIDLVKNGELKMNLRIKIHKIGDVVVASWKDFESLIDSENKHNLNVELMEIIQKNLVALAEKVKDSKKPEKKNGKKGFNPQFNYLMQLDHTNIGQLIGEGGGHIKKLKDEIKDTLDCDNVIIKILRHDESMPEQYRIVGSVSMSEENILFKITSFNSDRKYFAEVQKMLTNYVNDILVDQDEDKSDNKSDCEFGDFGDFCE